MGLQCTMVTLVASQGLEPNKNWHTIHFGSVISKAAAIYELPPSSYAKVMKNYYQVRYSLGLCFCLCAILYPGVLGQTGLTEVDKMVILNAHNQARRNATPAASNMELMVYMHASCSHGNGGVQKVIEHAPPLYWVHSMT